MVFLFGQKKEEKQPSTIQQIPVNEIRTFMKAGMSEQMIISELLKRGYTREQIVQGFREVLKTEVTGAPQTTPIPRHPQPEITPPVPSPSFEITEISTPKPAEPPKHNLPTPLGVPPERILMVEKPPIELPTAPGYAPKEEKYTFEEKPEEIAPKPEIPSPATEITLEEVVEGIVSEKFAILEERFSDFERKDMMLEEKIENLRHKIDEIEVSLKEREKTLLEKLDESSGKMEEIEGKISAVEKVFKETLPDLATSVRMINESIERIRAKEEVKNI
ncbi:MAG: hypothetical protein QXF15_01710 [Candidatus Aenigmatarchaeota archaeon]